MPTAPLKPCPRPACNNKTTGGPCPDCQRNEERRRGSAHARGYNRRWARERKRWLAEHPFCVDCEEEGITTMGTEVDHIKPHRGDMQLFWDRSNWATRCKPHHSAKTAREDGGFGR